MNVVLVAFLPEILNHCQAVLSELLLNLALQLRYLLLIYLHLLPLALQLQLELINFLDLDVVELVVEDGIVLPEDLLHLG